MNKIKFIQASQTAQPAPIGLASLAFGPHWHYLTGAGDATRPLQLNHGALELAGGTHKNRLGGLNPRWLHC